MSDLKVCSSCLSLKPLSDFWRNGQGRAGVRASCKECETAKHGGPNSWTARNRGARNAKNRALRAANPAKVAAERARRHAAKLRATPGWLNQAHHAEIDGIYHFAQVMTLITREQYHVDHEVPLRGRDVRGLHVPWNLAAIPASKNLLKNNKFIAC